MNAHVLNSELKSGKWSDRWFLAEEQPHITLEVGIKSNEVLPCRDKAPRPLIASGDKGQCMACLTVKATEKC